MNPLLTGIFLCALPGLGWLSYNRPNFAIKPIIAVAALLLLLHGGTFVYRNAWETNTHFIQDSIRNIKPTTVWKKKQLDKLNQLLEPIFTTSAKQENDFSVFWNTQFGIAYAVILCLLIFSWVCKETKPPDKPQ